MSSTYFEPHCYTCCTFDSGACKMYHTITA